ncbi:MAG: CaiB/BaiF CoA transferase family protein [Nocardioidaceae bacterium]
MTSALEGQRVVDITQSAAGPFCTMILGDLGADVVKVEKPEGGDDARSWAPPYWGPHGCTFLAMNRNKRSLAVDLKTAAGQAVVRDLLADADILVQNLRADSLDKLGFGYDAVRALNPRIVYCSMSAFGGRGPMSGQPGYDPLMQAYGGLMSITGEPATEGRPSPPPVRVGTSINDMGMGMWGAIGIMAALMERERTGLGQHVETSLLETAVGWIPYQIMAFLGSGTVPVRHGSGTSMNAPYEAFPTTDGHVMVAAGNNSLWTKLCHAVELPELLDDPRFTDNPDRVTHRAELAGLLSQRFRTETAEHWVALLTTAGVPSSPIRTIDQVVQDPQVDVLRLLRPVEHPDIDAYRDIGLPIQWDGVRAQTRQVPPALGADSREILAALGRTSEEIQQLVADNVIADDGA